MVFTSSNKRKLKKYELDKQCAGVLESSSKFEHGKRKYTLKPPAVPALMMRSGLNAWIDEYVTRDAEMVPTLSTPARQHIMIWKKSVDRSRQTEQNIWSSEHTWSSLHHEWKLFAICMHHTWPHSDKTSKVNKLQSIDKTNTLGLYSWPAEPTDMAFWNKVKLINLVGCKV